MYIHVKNNALVNETVNINISERKTVIVLAISIVSLIILHYLSFAIQSVLNSEDRLLFSAFHLDEERSFGTLFVLFEWFLSTFLLF